MNQYLNIGIGTAKTGVITKMQIAANSAAPNVKDAIIEAKRTFENLQKYRQEHMTKKIEPKLEHEPEQ